MISEISENKSTEVKTRDEEAFVESMLAQMRQLEELVIPQIEELSTKIPEIYDGYATVVRDTVSELLKAVDFKYIGKNCDPRVGVAVGAGAAILAIGAEVTARIMQAYGQFKAAREHNRMLKKMLQAKELQASLNIDKNRRAEEQAYKSLNKTKNFFLKYARQQTPQDISEEAALRFASLCQRALNLYRTNYFLWLVTIYLEEEYNCWLKGVQTSGLNRPDYFTVNHDIMELMFNNPYGALVHATEKSGGFTGAEMILLTDTQLTLYALNGKLCVFDREEASPVVGALMQNNPGFNSYENINSKLIKKIKKGPGKWIYGLWLLLTVGVILLSIYVVPGALWLKIVLGISAVAVISIMTYHAERELKFRHVVQVEMMKEENELEMESSCGKVPQIEFDYEKKSLVKAWFKGFLD